jgi:hypothetical protein
MIISVLAVEQAPADEVIDVGIANFNLIDRKTALSTVPPSSCTSCAGPLSAYATVRYDLVVTIFF